MVKLRRAKEKIIKDKKVSVSGERGLLEEKEKTTEGIKRKIIFPMQKKHLEIF